MRRLSSFSPVTVLMGFLDSECETELPGTSINGSKRSYAGIWRSVSCDLRRPLSTGLSGRGEHFLVSEETGQSVDGRLGNVVLNALRVSFGGLRWNANG